MHPVLPILTLALLTAGGGDDEVSYWLRNAVGFHRFSPREAAQATGLAPEDVERRLAALKIEPGGVPAPEEGSPLTILPYPGGRHPRLGFLDGAQDPRREAKFSVFLPGEAGYVVIDLPEAVFSNLGLLYLAHTHIPTVWDAKKVELPSLEWRRRPDGSIELDRVLPNGVAFGVRALPRRDGAKMELWLRNGTSETLTGLRVQICAMLGHAAGFEAQTNDNKQTVKLPRGEAKAARSADGKRWVAMAWERSRAWANAPCPCLHSDPTLPDCPPGATVRVMGRFLVGEGSEVQAELERRQTAGQLLPPEEMKGAEETKVNRPAGAKLLKAGAASAEIEADDSMVIGGGIGPGQATGQEGHLRASAIVVRGDGAAAGSPVAIVACDILMVSRDILDEAARRIEKSYGIPFENVLINASHTHHAPTTATIHGYERDEKFSKRVRSAIVEAVGRAKKRMKDSSPTELLFAMGEEKEVGQNSRLLLSDGTIYWIGPREDVVRPTGPFDPELPVLGLRREDGKFEALLFNHSTHCIGTRAGGKRSPGFYGLAAQDIEGELGGTALFVAGAFGSTHNLRLGGDEMARRIASAVRTALGSAGLRDAAVIRSRKKEVVFRVREFDDAKEDAAVAAYCRKRASGAEYIIEVFRKMRSALAAKRGQEQRTWIQALRIGDVAIVGVPGEFFTKLGLDIKERSPFPNTLIAGVANDYIGYIPDSEAYDLGGYQVWTGFHSFVARGTGEMIVDEAVKLLEELHREFTIE